MSDSPPLEAVEKLLEGRYSRLVPLGSQGAQGTVYKAVATDGTTVAVKLYHADQLEERTRREVDALTRLTAETIVKLHGAGNITIDEDDYRFIATTFIEGQPLSEVVAAGALNPAQSARIGVDVALAIDELWSLRIVHRDIKPANIMLTLGGRAILIDLGVARHLDLATLTGPGLTWGTPGYLAPESLRGQKPTCKADIFSLGIVIEEMLIGRHPTRRRQDLLMAGGPSISRHRPDTPTALAEIVDRMVALNPYLRPMPRDATERLTAVAIQIDGGR